MKKAITAAWILLLPFLLSAQIGLINGYQSLYAPNWEQKIRQNYELPDIKVFGPSVFTGFNLYSSSKKKGVQWTPEFHLSRHEIKVTISDPDLIDPSFGFNPITDRHRSTIAGLTFNGEFFFLRFAHPNGDPALANFSRFKRGLFFRLGLGFDLLVQSRRSDTFDFGFGFGFGGNRSNRTTALAGHLKIGLGLENFITPFLTITPIISSSFHTNTPWTTLATRSQNLTFDPFGNPISPNNPPIGSINGPRDAFIQLQAAIRLKINLKEFGKALKKT